VADPGSTARLAGLALALLDRTVRITVVHGERLDQAERSDGGFIHAFWHGQLLLASLVHDGKPTAAMISRHGDGELIARVVERRSIRAVRGSTTRGGPAAFREMLDLVHDGWTRLAITPDGPRGPRHRVQSGIVRLSALTGFPIIPAGLAARPVHQFRSWDGFLVPWPGARVRVHYGEPVRVAKDADDRAHELIRGQLEACLLTLTAEAESALGIRR